MLIKYLRNILHINIQIKSKSLITINQQHSILNKMILPFINKLNKKYRNLIKKNIFNNNNISIGICLEIEMIILMIFIALSIEKIRLNSIILIREEMISTKFPWRKSLCLKLTKEESALDYRAKYQRQDSAEAYRAMSSSLQRLTDRGVVYLTFQ